MWLTPLFHRCEIFLLLPCTNAQMQHRKCHWKNNINYFSTTTYNTRAFWTIKEHIKNKIQHYFSHVVLFFKLQVTRRPACSAPVFAHPKGQNKYILFYYVLVCVQIFVNVMTYRKILNKCFTTQNFILISWNMMYDDHWRVADILNVQHRIWEIVLKSFKKQ